jgi:hypothetical protein
MAHEQNSFLGISWLYSTYMWVWFALLVLTVVEVIVPEPQLIGLAAFPRWVVVLSLIMLALGKTFLVAWYYMHLIDERPSIIGIACAPFIFSVFLTIGLWPHRAQMPEDTESADAEPAVESVEQASIDGPDSEASSGGMTLAAESFNRRK